MPLLPCHLVHLPHKEIRQVNIDMGECRKQLMKALMQDFQIQAHDVRAQKLQLKPQTDNSQLEMVEQIWRHITERYAMVVTVGDFNFPHSDWDSDGAEFGVSKWVS